MSERIAMKFAKEYDITPGPSSAVSWMLCEHCGEVFYGRGARISESGANAEQKLREHDCPAKQQRTGDEPV